MKSVLITGGAGNVGGALADRLVSSGDYEVTIIDNFSTGSHSKLPSNRFKNWHFHNVDVNDYASLASIMKAKKFDFVFHYAALVGVERTLKRPLDVLEDLKGIEYIGQLAVETNVKRLFFASSSEVYGEPVEFPQNEETTPLNAKLPYAKVKSLGESFYTSFNKEHGLEYTIFRFFNTYGPKQSNDFVLGRFIRAALNDEKITVIGDGSQTRTFCYIDDNLDVTQACLEQGIFKNEILNLGNDYEISILDLAKKVISTLNSNSEIVHLPARKDGDMRRRLPDLTKLNSTYKKEFVSLEEGIKKVAASFLQEKPKQRKSRRRDEEDMLAVA